MSKMGRYVSLDIEIVLEALNMNLNISGACNEGLKIVVENEKKRRELEKNKGVGGQTTPMSNQTQIKKQEYHKETRDEYHKEYPKEARNDKL